MKFIDKNISVTSDIYDEHISDPANWFGDLPPFTNLELNIVGLCNRTCFFCPKADRERFPNLNEHLSDELYRSLLLQLAGVGFKGRISLCGLSEPYLHRDLNGLIALTKRHCPETFLDLLTNGDFLTPENVTSAFAAGLDNMKISAYDGPEQMERMEAIRQACGLSVEKFVVRQRYLSQAENFGITINNRGGAVDLEEYGVVPLKEPLKRSCFYPFHKLIIDYNGDVMVCPCDWDKRLVIGNLNSQSIFEIWNCQAMKELRLRLIKEDRSQQPCLKCDTDGTLYARAHFEAWKTYYGV